MFGLSHTEQGAVYARDRDITAYSFGPNHYDANFGTGPYGRIRQVSAAGAATGFNHVVNHTGGENGDGVSSDPRNSANYHTYANGNADKYNSSLDMMFQMPTKLDTIFTKGSVELPFNSRFNTTAMFSQRQSSQQVAGYPLSSTSQASNPVYVDRNSYYNPYGNAALGGTGGQDLFFYRRTIELPRITDNENRTIHIDANLEGDFTLGGKPFNWSVGYNHSAVNGATASTGNLNLVNLKKALGPSFMNASGVVQCGTATAPIPAAECVPFNILGGPSTSTAAALAYINSNGQSTYGSTINSATADIGGELFNVRSDTSFTNAYKVKSAADADWVNYAGEYYYNKVKSNVSLDWELGNWNATWTARFQSKTKDQCWDVDVECSNPDGETSFGTGYNTLAPSSTTT